MGAYLSADCLHLALLRGQGHGFADGQHGLPHIVRAQPGCQFCRVLRPDSRCWLRRCSEARARRLVRRPTHLGSFAGH